MRSRQTLASVRGGQAGMGFGPSGLSLLLPGVSLERAPWEEAHRLRWEGSTCLSLPAPDLLLTLRWHVLNLLRVHFKTWFKCRDLSHEIQGCSGSGFNHSRAVVCMFEILVPKYSGIWRGDLWEASGSRGWCAQEWDSCPKKAPEKPLSLPPRRDPAGRRHCEPGKGSSQEAP